MKLVHLTVLCLQSMLPAYPQVYPKNYTLLTATVVEVNGSSLTGHCSDHTTNGVEVLTCRDPTSSVLFDGNIPTLTGLDGDMWASQLLTIYKAEVTTDIIFDFRNMAGYAGVGRVEMVILNCPSWGISPDFIRILGASSTDFFSYDLGYKHLPTFFTASSCDSLLRLCFTVSPTSLQRPILTLEFSLLASGMEWVHIAEITFYPSGGYCPPDALLSTDAPSANTVHSANTFPTFCRCGEVHCEKACPSPSSSSSTAAILGSSIPLTILAVVAFVAGVVTVYKCCSNHQVRYERADQEARMGEEGEEEGGEQPGEEVHFYEEIPDVILDGGNGARLREHGDQSDHNIAANVQQQRGDMEAVTEFALQRNNAYRREPGSSEPHDELFMLQGNHAYGRELNSLLHDDEFALQGNNAYWREMDSLQPHGFMLQNSSRAELEDSQHGAIMLRGNNAYGVELESGHRSYENIVEDI